MVSCIYEGSVRHRRMNPVAHQFKYRLFMIYFDLDELPALLDSSIGLRDTFFSPASFCRKDHLGDFRVPLIDSVREFVKAHTGQPCSGPIRMLTHVRSFGYYFSPLNLYYCFESNGTDIDCIVAEVTNTPWLEKHWYVLWEKNRISQSQPLHFRHAKEFHVSPFMQMDADYEWDLGNPGLRLKVSIAEFIQNQKLFDVTMVLNRKGLDRGTLRRTLVRYPIMSLRISLAIYWQAFQLLRKGCSFYSHPKQ